MADALDEVDPLQVIDDLQCVLHMALYAKGERFKALEENEIMDRRERCPRVTEKDRPDPRDKCRRACRLHKGNSMVGRIRLYELRELVPVGCPVEGSSVDNDAADRGSVSSDELRRRFDDDIRTVLDGPEQVGRCESVVDNDRNAVGVRNFGDSFDIDDLTVRISEGLDIERLGIIFDRLLKVRRIERVDEGRLDIIVDQCVGKEIVSSAVNISCSYDMVTGEGYILDRVGDRRGSGGDRQGRDPALEGCDPPLKNILRRVRETSVDIAGIPETEAVRCVFAVPKDEGCRLVDRNCAGVRDRIVIFLPDVKLLCLKFPVPGCFCCNLCHFLFLQILFIYLSIFQNM